MNGVTQPILLEANRWMTDDSNYIYILFWLFLFFWMFISTFWIKARIIFVENPTRVIETFHWFPRVFRCIVFCPTCEILDWFVSNHPMFYNFLNYIFTWWGRFLNRFFYLFRGWFLRWTARFWNRLGFHCCCWTIWGIVILIFDAAVQSWSSTWSRDFDL